jgi:hypothetical protein
MDRNEGVKRLQLVTALAEQFGRKNSEAGLMMFVNATGDIPIQAFEAGVMRAARESKYMPSPAEIRQLSGDVPRLGEADRSVLAWDRVVTAIRQIGGYQTPAFDDPVIAATIRTICGSWADLCETPSETLHVWTKKAFLETYRAHAASGHVTAIAASPLPGILATDAALGGYPQPTPIAVQTGLPASFVKVIGNSAAKIESESVKRIAQDCVKSLGLPQDDIPVEETPRRSAQEQMRILMDRIKQESP